MTEELTRPGIVSKFTAEIQEADTEYNRLLDLLNQKTQSLNTHTSIKRLEVEQNLTPEQAFEKHLDDKRAEGKKSRRAENKAAWVAHHARLETLFRSAADFHARQREIYTTMEVS